MSRTEIDTSARAYAEREDYGAQAQHDPLYQTNDTRWPEQRRTRSIKERAMLTFYFSPGSSSMAVHVALHEVGATFDPKPVSFATKEHQTPAFRAINPAGKVPALLIDGRLLTEVAGILFYLARRFPEAGLLPEDIEAQAQVVSWMSFIASSIHPANRKADQARAIYTIADQRL